MIENNSIVLGCLACVSLATIYVLFGPNLNQPSLLHGNKKNKRRKRGNL